MRMQLEYTNNFIGIYIVSLAKRMENIFKIESQFCFLDTLKECKFIALLNQTVMKFFSITKGKKEKNNNHLLLF